MSRYRGLYEQIESTAISFDPPNDITPAFVRFQDMDLIEVLWKQDVDLGFTLVEPATAPTKKPSTSEKESADEIEKLKALEAINATNQKVRENFFLFFFLFSVSRATNTLRTVPISFR